MKRTSLQVKIPVAMREQLAHDPFMRNCIINDNCEGRIEWQHAFTYAGRRRNEVWAILPMCSFHHRTESKHRWEQREAIQKRIHHFAAEKDVRTNYPRVILV